MTFLWLDSFRNLLLGTQQYNTIDCLNEAVDSGLTVTSSQTPNIFAIKKKNFDASQNSINFYN